MTKSSPSLKKLKQSRDSSKLLRSVNKKKTKRNKSKKIKDYSDESESSRSDSSLYSSSEDDYRRKKRRSKVSKKRSRKRYSSSESDDYDDDRLLKKKKRSKRKNERVGKKKKISSRKIRKRYSSSSSTNSESRSFRNNQSDGGREGDVKRKTRDRGRLGKVKAVRRRSEDELEEDNGPDEFCQVEDEIMTEKNSRRLKSIVVVSYTYDNDHRKEDIADDHDDESDEDRFVDDERDREARRSHPKSGLDGYGRKTVDYDEFDEDIKSESSKSCLPENSLKDDDLEVILKKRALENLNRFRGEIQRSAIASKEALYVSEGEPLRRESEKVEESQDSVCAGIKNLETSQKVLQDSNVKKSGTLLAEFASQQDQQPDETAKVKASSGISSCTTKRKLIRPVFGQESRKDADAESNNGSTIDQNCPESSLDRTTRNGSETIEPTKAVYTLREQSSSHADTETLDEIKEGSQSEQKTMEETKDESQYEQKTMTVMRGGEMVQVSYKVYIPKKTSSLGRRQLKR